MPEIRVLDPHIADLIAAGEVVERPASVVKELMENAIDAGAGKVTVEIAHGGLTLIRVTDDGCGIPPEQLKTAFLRHATSKLRTQYDLEAIGTLGFRGEALAAIAAVSRIDVLSRTPEAPLGCALSLEGGAPGETEEAGCPEGTTMVVRDLFFNTPARQKFMKKDAAEGAAVFAAVQRTALSHPEVSVKFIRDGKQELLTPGDGKLRSAVYAVLGRETALGLLEVQGSGEDMAVRGFASLPACCRGSRNSQYFFVNGRQVRSKLMTAALEEAYQNQKMVGKFPACVLCLETRLNAVDVNVHPTKLEVKFANERQVFSAVYYGVLSALDASRAHPVLETGHAPASRPATEEETPRKPAPRGDAFQTMTAQQYRAGALPLHDGAGELLKRTAPADPSPRPEPPSAPDRGRRSGGVSVWAEEEREIPPRPAGAAAPSREEKQRPEPPEKRPAPGAAPPAEEEPAPWRVAGEVLNTYIIVEQGERVLFIDKHAAHERMNFDRLKREGSAPMMQALLTPVTFTPPPEEGAVLLDSLPLLSRFGFEVEAFGGGALVVRQAPDYIAVEEIAPTLTEIAGKLLTTGRADPESARDEVMHTIACKAAIKGGWHTAPQELERIAQAVMSGQVKYCPHGRPVAVELTKKDLEKQFRRI